MMAWSDAARRASAESRRAKSAGGKSLQRNKSWRKGFRTVAGGKQRVQQNYNLEKTRKTYGKTRTTSPKQTPAKGFKKTSRTTRGR